MSTPIVHVPFVYHVGPLEVGGFGLAMLMCFVAGQIVGQNEMERRGHDPAIISDLIFAGVIGGLLGGKIYYAILTQDVSALFSRSGFVFWGGLIGGMLAGTAVVLAKKQSFNRISDASATGMAAAYAVGRTGCWAVGDDYGRPWDSPLAVQFPNGVPPSTAENMSGLFGVSFPPGTAPDQVIAVHPTQLYEVALGLVMFGILWRLRDHKHAAGWLFGFYLLLSGLERFLVEFLRAKDDRFFGALTMAQLIAIVFIVAGGAWMYMRRNSSDQAPGIYA